MTTKPANSDGGGAFWRVEDDAIIIAPPVLTVWSKFRLGLAVLIAMLAGFFAVVVFFHPGWLHLPRSRASELGAGTLFLAAIIQMLLTVTTVLGALAIVRGDAINVRGRRYARSRIIRVAVETRPFSPADRPALTVVIRQRRREKKITVVPSGMALASELTPLARRLETWLQQQSASNPGAA